MKDASIGTGLAQVSSQVIGVKLMNAEGAVEEVSEDADPERMRVIRSSYGLLGVIFEVTFRIQPAVILRYGYAAFPLNPPPTREQLLGGADGMLGLVQPYADRIIVERRFIDRDGRRPISRRGSRPRW
jgi:FAD/FMN-containing dehydrogenase